MDITKATHDYVKKLHEDDEDRTRTLHVTDITSRCPVGVVLEKAGKVVAVKGSGKQLRFEVGHIVEELTRKALKEAGVIHKGQKKQYSWPELNMTGTPDIGIVDGKQHILVEVKSIHPNALDKMDGKAHPHYIEQLQVYLSEYRKEFPEAVGKLFYLSLDGRTAEFSMAYDQAIVDGVMKRAAILDQCLKEEKRPSLLPYFVQEPDRRNGGFKWQLNWKAMYCLLDGIHEHCDPALWTALEPEDADKMVAKLQYQAKKANDNGTNPNEWITSVKGQAKVEEKDGLTYEKVN